MFFNIKVIKYTYFLLFFLFTKLVFKIKIGLTVIKIQDFGIPKSPKINTLRTISPILILKNSFVNKKII